LNRNGHPIDILIARRTGGGFGETMELKVLPRERNVSPGYGSDPSRGVVTSTEAMLRHLSATSEGFAYGSTALSAALRGDRRAVIAASLTEADAASAALSCWHCGHDEHGIALQPFSVLPDGSPAPVTVEAGAAQILGGSARGDVLVVCDPWGENELLCWALRMASPRGITTIAVTGDHPNLLAALAVHAVRVPAPPPRQRELVVSALRHFVQTAGATLVPVSRRVTGPLRAVEIA
jgi:hypothetical protein